jgi:hypothetical protein
MADESITLTDEDIVTTRVGGAQPLPTADRGDDSGDVSDTSDTGDDSGDTGDTSDTGDDSGDTSDTSDTGDDAG